MKKYTVAQIGCGKRGKIHIDGWSKNNERCTLAAVCDIDRNRMDDAIKELEVVPALYSDADKMMTEVRPDILCFSTQPSVRLELVELAVRHKVKGLVFEKPMAVSLDVARKITGLCNENHIKTAVCFQHKYLSSFRKFKSVLNSGEIGKVLRFEASCQAGLSLLGSHYIDYILWANGGCRAKWVAGHVHGKSLLDDSLHPSPDYALARMGFENGVFATFESGKLSAMYMGKPGNCIDNRLTAYGQLGYAWCDTDGGWGVFSSRTGGEMLGGKGESWETQERTSLQPLFVRDLLAWLDDDSKLHPCNIDISYHGYEIMEAICLSSLDDRRIDLPLPSEIPEQNIFDRMRRELPECPARF